MKHFHLPLPDETHAELRAEAERSRRKAIAEYAVAMAGTPLDLDRALESAAVEELLRIDGNAK